MIEFTLEATRSIPDRSYDSDWEDKAACRECNDPDIFFIPELMDQAITQYCEVCPVTTECHLLGEKVSGRVEMRYGVWGGVRPETFRKKR